jgi:23S rRNA pseudouridine1911/1915/1917 synthase
MRLDLAVSRAFGLPRRGAREAVRSGRIDVDGAACDEPGRDVREEAKIEFHPERPARHRVRTRLTVLAEDADFVIVDKPAGLLTVPTSERESDTLLARVLDYLHHRFRRRPVAFVVHRLDKETSGSVVFARTRPALHFLQDLFRRHEIGREYVAIVEGAPPDSGVFSEDLARDRPDLRRRVARPGQPGKRAVTHYRTLEPLPGAALVSVELETGRTHQIRIHFAAAGHPVVGDRVYGRAGREEFPEVPRQMLHARRLSFAHPRTGELVRVESGLPEDFALVLGQLRRKKKRPGKPGAPKSDNGRKTATRER